METISRAPSQPVVRRAAWAAVVVALAGGCADLALRQVARTWSLPAESNAYVALGVVAAALAGIWMVRAEKRGTAAGRADRIVVLGLVGAFACGMAAQQRLGARLQSDGFCYYSYLRSLAFDQDVDFTNDYQMLGLAGRPLLLGRTVTGHAHSNCTIGPAIVWSPFFAGGHVVANVLAARGKTVTADGTSFPYRQAVCIASLFYGLVGIFLCYRLAALFFPRAVSAASAAVIALGSFILWYLVKEPTMSHAASFCAVAGFTCYWAATRGRRSLSGWVLLGLLAGLATTIRWQNALFALLPATEFVQTVFDMYRGRRGRQIPALIGAGALFTASATVGFLPQMFAWKAIYGAYLAVSPLGPPILWTQPAVVNILWSSQNGLLSTSPILYLAVLGLLAFLRRDPRFAVAALVTLSVMVYFNASISDWWGSASIGMRRFDGVLPLMTVGLALFMTASSRFVARHPSVVIGVLGGLLVLWNATFMGAVLSNAVSVGEPMSFSALAGHQAEIVERWVGYPFSYPANLLYAARYDVSPARYDWLGPGALLSDPRRPYGEIDLGAKDEAVVEDGWHRGEQDGASTFRWTRASATLLVPLHHAADLSVQVRIHPFDFPGAPPQVMRIVVNGTTHGPFTLQPGWQDVQFPSSAAEWRGGLNRVVFGFSRETPPAQVGLGGDGRPLAARIDFVRVRVGSEAGRAR